jgi:hypothetical protein
MRGFWGTGAKPCMPEFISIEGPSNELATPGKTSDFNIALMLLSTRSKRPLTKSQPSTIQIPSNETASRQL